jgi:hypothetical protein
VDIAGGSVWDCLPYLTNPNPGTNKKTGLPCFTGNVNNLKVIASDRGVYITGSLAKFYLGTNLHTLTRSDTIQAFEKIADTLCLPIHRAKVTRIDAGPNIITDLKPERYYQYLGQYGRFTRSTFKNTLYYHTSKKSITIYNKIDECKNAKVPIPEIYVGKNVLRFEVSYINRLPKQFNQAVITPDTLTNERFYMDMYDRWYNDYESIDKVGLFNMDIKNINTPKDYLDEFLAACLLEKGLDNVFNHIETLREQNVYKQSEYYSVLKRKIKDMVSTKDKAEQPELIQELNKKMAKAKQYYR